MTSSLAPELGFRKIHKVTFGRFRSKIDQEFNSVRVWYGWFTGRKPSSSCFKTSSGVCSAGLYSINETARKKGVRVYPTIRPSVLAKDKELCERWFNWVVHESPFQGALRVKSFAYAFTYGFAINPDEDVWKVHFALQSLRQLQEHPEKIFVWKHLVDDFDVPPMQAFAIAEFCQGTVDNCGTHYTGSHGDLFNSAECSLEAFLREPTLCGDSFAKAGTYSGIGSYMFRKKSGEKCLRHYYEDGLDRKTPARLLAIEKSLKKKEDKPAYINPFANENNTKVSPEAMAIFLHSVFLGG